MRYLTTTVGASMLAVSLAFPAVAAVCDEATVGGLISRVPADIAGIVHELAPTYQLDPVLVLAMMDTESAFKPRAVSPKAARGLMQLIPATARRFGVRDVFDPEQNIRGGMAYMRWLLDEFAGNVSLALSGYNAGEAAVRRYAGIPPYRETRDYVARISRFIGCVRFVSFPGKAEAPASAPVKTAVAPAFKNPWEPPKPAPVVGVLTTRKRTFPY